MYPRAQSWELSVVLTEGMEEVRCNACGKGKEGHAPCGATNSFLSAATTRVKQQSQRTTHRDPPPNTSLDIHEETKIKKGNNASQHKATAVQRERIKGDAVNAFHTARPSGSPEDRLGAAGSLMTVAVIDTHTVITEHAAAIKAAYLLSNPPNRDGNTTRKS